MMDEELKVSLPLLQCRWLTISSYVSKVSFLMLDKLLRSTPNLENLMMFPDLEVCYYSSHYFLPVCIFHLRVKCWLQCNITECVIQFQDFSIFQNAEKDTEALELYDPLSFQDNIFKDHLQNLKIVKVMPFCTSEATELDQFLKFLLEHAINLEKLVILPEHKGCNNCATNTSQLRKCLSLFPRASMSAVISLGPVTKNVFNTL